MKASWFALVLILVAVISVIGGGYYIGFWREVAPYTLQQNGPAGLNGEFASSLVSGGIIMLVQLAATFLIVTMVLGQQERQLRTNDRLNLAKKVAELYARTANQLSMISSAGRGTQRYQHKEREFSILSSFYGRQLQHDELEQLSAVNEQFDKIAYDGDFSELSTYELMFDSLLRPLIPETGATRAWHFVIGKKSVRKSLIDEVMTALKSLAEARQQPSRAAAA